MLLLIYYLMSVCRNYLYRPFFMSIHIITWKLKVLIYTYYEESPRGKGIKIIKIGSHNIDTCSKVHYSNQIWSIVLLLRALIITTTSAMSNTNYWLSEGLLWVHFILIRNLHQSQRRTSRKTNSHKVHRSLEDHNYSIKWIISDSSAGSNGDMVNVKLIYQRAVWLGVVPTSRDVSR